MSFNTIIGHWHIWEGSTPGTLMISNEETKKLYTAADIDFAVNFMYMEAGVKEGRKLWAEWNAHKEARA